MAEKDADRQEGIDFEALGFQPLAAFEFNRRTSEIILRAQRGERFVVTRFGEITALVIGPADYEQLRLRENELSNDTVKLKVVDPRDTKKDSEKA